MFGLGGPSPGSDYFYTSAVTFPIPLAHPLEPDHVVPVALGLSPQPHCPGQGRADLGYLCVYADRDFGMAPMTTGDIANPLAEQAGVSRNGFVAYAKTTAATGAAEISGTWTASGG